MSGGDGIDEVFNFGGIAVSSTATAEAVGTSVEIFGVASQTAGSTSVATAVGLNGGGGDDAIANVGFVQALSVADARVSNAAWNLVGTSSQQGLVTATASSVGMAGESGDDVLFNDGEVDVDVRSTLLSDGSVTAAIGGASANTSIGGVLRGFGMAGGDGDDQILNADLVSVDSSLVSTSTGTAWNLIGVAGGSTGIYADNVVFGLSGGAGDDLVANAGSVLVEARSVMNSDSSAWTFAGASSGTGTLSSIVQATGMAGDGGIDWLYNEGLVDVSATSILNSTSVSFAFAGGASSETSLSAFAHSTGLQGGIESDQVFNIGSLLVDAVATNTATGGAQTVVGDVSIVAVTNANAYAYGMNAGTGDDVVVNVGTMDIASFANPNSISGATAGGFFVDGISGSHTNSVSRAVGASLDNGANLFLNEGSVLIAAGGTGSSESASIGSDFSLTADAFADATASISAAQALGVTAGDGNNRIYNQGIVSAVVTITAGSSASADGSGLLEGAGDAYAEASANATSASGIDTGHGDNLIANAGEITVSIESSATTDSFSNASGIDFFTAARSNADTNALADDALAIGVRAGDGDNTIWNGGAITVITAPQAHSTGSAVSLDFSFAVDAFADALAAADNAHAFGILAGDGANVIHNANAISVISAPRAISSAFSEGLGWDGDAESTAIATANGALAVGIFAGDGGNLVVNQGTIWVTANPTAFASAIATPGGDEIAGVVTNTRVCRREWRWSFLNWFFNEVCELVASVGDKLVDDGEAVESENTAVNDAQAIGIWTGDGDDVIVNSGSIETWVSAGAVNRHGIAIQSGAGNDTVILQDGSTLIGDVDLGADDDSLYLLGTPEATGDLDGGTGLDRLLIDGTSVLEGSAFGFENLRLYGLSNFTLNNLGSVDELDIHQGTLNILGNYSFASLGNFNVHINSDGSHGQLNVGGNTSLGGGLHVTNGGGPYINGTTWDVITAGSVSGSFDNLQLPTPTTLVSFSVDQGPTGVDIVADVTPFTAMASGASETAVARYLDDILPGSTGSVSDLLAMMQSMPEDDFAAGFRSLNPTTFDTYQVTDRSMRHHLSGTHSRLAAIRSNLVGSNGNTHAAFMSDRETLYLSAGNVNAQFADPQIGGPGVERNIPVNAWTVSYVSDTNQGNTSSSLQGSDFTTAGFSMGVDNQISENFVAGISLGTALSTSKIDGGFGEGEVGSRFTSIYATYMPTVTSYVETVVSHSDNYFVNQRNIEIGSLERFTASGHSSEMFSAFVEAGRITNFDSLRSQVFGSVYYSSLDEGGFEEVGAGAINIIVDPRRYEMASLELGWRGFMDIKTRNGTLLPQFNIAYLYNYGFGDKQMSVRFSGVPDMSFSPASADISGSGVRWGLGLNFIDNNGWTLGSQFGGEFSNRDNYLGGTLQISRGF